MQKRFKILYFLLVPALAMAPVWLPALAAPIHFDQEPVAIQTARGIRHFTVELALTPAQQELGLMHRQTLAPGRGMLFVMPENNTIRMWMKDTLVPLDMLFVNARGKIVAIAEDAAPESTTVISSGKKASGVVELLGGTAKTEGIMVGDTVLSRYFGTAP